MEKQIGIPGLFGMILSLVIIITTQCDKQASITAAGSYTTVQIDRGDILTTITSSGTLQPVATVDVGTQVSGIVEKLYVDFNDVVKKGQVIAELDRTVLSGILDEAIASRDRDQALYDFAKEELERNEPLFAKGFISEQTISKLRSDLRIQEAQLHSANATVKKAQTNLQYTTIRSPINGTVINRNIDAGQTVAASFSAPTLFIIAEDLHTMQILANVDEADIGSVQKGQEVHFTVQTFPDRTFSGIVNQVRLQPVISQNVVTYTVVIAAENSDGLLLPGMTATIDFIIAKATDVLRVPNAALRFKPFSDSSGAGGAFGNRARNGKSALYGQHSADTSQQPKQMHKHPTGDRGAHIWTLGPENRLIPLQVSTGISDGKFTELKSGTPLAEGSTVITGTLQTEKTKKKSVSIIPQPGPPGRH